MRMITTPFYYVRHGQTDWNVENRAMGQKDIPLNSHGIEQAIEARSSLIGAGIATICHSPLSRAKQTAEIFNEVLCCKLIPIDELQEFYLGSYAGQIKEQWFRDWRSGSILEGTESYQAFLDRCLIGIHKALEHPGPVLIVSHGGVYWAVQHALKRQREDLPNCSPLFHLPPPSGSTQWKVTPCEAR